ncbi:MAG: transposase [Chloroflexota bacterium]|nr:transposase [Chloroflexota bacterium]
MSAEAFGVALANFARDEGIDALHRAVVVVDRAGWHVARGLVVPAGIDLVFLPPSSPELQPAERLWGLVDEPVANRTFADLDALDALEAVLVSPCNALAAQPGSRPGPHPFSLVAP